MAANSNSKSADGKFADLQKDTVELNDKQHMTTDYGIKISDPDHWLRVADEKKTGPSLLEDQIAREKVHRLQSSPDEYKQKLTIILRSCVSITNASQSE
jgi:catalase